MTDPSLVVELLDAKGTDEIKELIASFTEAEAKSCLTLLTIMTKERKMNKHRPHH